MPNLAIFSYCYPDCAFDLLFYLSLVCIALAYLWYVLVINASLLPCLLMLLLYFLAFGCGRGVVDSLFLILGLVSVLLFSLIYAWHGGQDRQ